MLYFINGFMGSGKSTLGKLLAEEMGLSFTDLDREIELREGMNIAQIFDQKGEVYFREIEKEILRSFEQHQNIMIACGGGTACFHDNIIWMNQQGKTIYFKMSEEVLFERLNHDAATRPLIKKMNDQELKNFIHQKLKDRSYYYEQSVYIFDVEIMNLEAMRIALAH